MELWVVEMVVQQLREVAWLLVAQVAQLLSPFLAAQPSTKFERVSCMGPLVAKATIELYYQYYNLSHYNYLSVVF
jgi:hypothetical protein